MELREQVLITWLSRENKGLRGPGSKYSLPFTRRLLFGPMGGRSHHWRALFEPSELARPPKVASAQSDMAGLGVNGFGSFCRNKRTSAAGPKPGNPRTKVPYEQEINYPDFMVIPPKH